MGQDLGPQIAEVFFFLGVICVIALVVLVVLGHFLSYNRLMDWMGWIYGKEFRKFLKRKRRKEFAIQNIPQPPDGNRDGEIEGLMKTGKIFEARELLDQRMQEAKFAPIGSEAKMKNAVHYLSLLD